MCTSISKSSSQSWLFHQHRTAALHVQCLPPHSSQLCGGISTPNHSNRRRLSDSVMTYTSHLPAPCLDNIITIPLMHLVKRQAPIPHIAHPRACITWTRQAIASEAIPRPTVLVNLHINQRLKLTTFLATNLASYFVTALSTIRLKLTPTTLTDAQFLHLH